MRQIALHWHYLNFVAEQCHEFVSAFTNLHLHLQIQRHWQFNAGSGGSGLLRASPIVQCQQLGLYTDLH
jgi:hypothetical protein